MNDQNNELALSYLAAPLVVANFTAFSQFNRDLVQFNQTEFTLVGSVLQSAVGSNIGIINAVGLPINSSISVLGRLIDAGTLLSFL